MLSIVIAAKNCADRIAGTVKPWQGVASEVIVVDQFSSDGTADRARELGCRVIESEPAGGNFDLNRKKGMLEARSEWILYIDTDERPTPELLSEVRDFIASPASAEFAGAKIPNEFYFLGKPLKHGLYSKSSAEVRLVRKGKWDYPCEDGFHRGVSAQGKVHRFQNAYRHFNVNTLSEWFVKTNQYTEHDAVKTWPSAKIRTFSAFYRAGAFFFRHYFWKLGFLDGFHGLVSIFYFMLYHLTLDVKKWEKKVLASKTLESDYLEPIKTGQR